MNWKLFFQIIMGVFGSIGIIYALSEPNSRGGIIFVVSVILIALLLASIL